MHVVHEGRVIMSCIIISLPSHQGGWCHSRAVVHRRLQEEEEEGGSRGCVRPHIRWLPAHTTGNLVIPHSRDGLRWNFVRSCIKSGNLINPRWLELKCREVQLEKVYCICVLWLCDSYEAVSFLCPWLRFDQESLIYDMLSSVVREPQTTALLCCWWSLLEYADFHFCVAGLPYSGWFTICAITLWLSWAAGL